MHTFLSVVALLLCVFSCQATEIIEFQYGQGHEGVTPYQWSQISSYCSGFESNARQSPIDITGSVYSSALQKLKFDYSSDVTCTLINTGHSLQCGSFSEDTTLTLTGGPFGNDQYRLLQFHMHWGTTEEGSEHWIDGEPATAEIHFVHANTKYTADDVLNHKDGLAVVGVLVDLGSSSSDSLQHLFDSVPDVIADDEQHLVSNIKLTGMLPASKEYYHYQGSLTTPGCNEAVKWIVMREHVTMTEEELKDLQDLTYVEEDLRVSVGPNYRPLQPRNGRSITRNFGDDEEDSSSATLLTIGLSLILLLALF